MTGNGRLETALPWLFVIGFLLVWQLACLVFHIPAFVLPSPTLIAASLQKQIGPIMENSWVTLLRTLVGFAIAVVLGVLLGLAIGMFRFIYRGLYPVLVGFNSIPKVAVVPVFVIWFGIGTIPAVLTAFLVSFFPIAVNVATGLATIEPELLERHARAWRQAAHHPVEDRAAAVDAVFLCLIESRDHAGIRRHNRLGDRGFQ